MRQQFTRWDKIKWCGNGIAIVAIVTADDASTTANVLLLLTLTVTRKHNELKKSLKKIKKMFEMSQQWKRIDAQWIVEPMIGFRVYIHKIHSGKWYAVKGQVNNKNKKN